MKIVVEKVFEIKIFGSGIGNLLPLPLPLPLPLLMKKTKIYDKKVLREKIRLSTVRGNL